MNSMDGKRLDYIDALRGLAILGVVMVHCGQDFDNLPSWVRSFTDYGGRGVQLFFVLSALTLAEVYSGKVVSTRVFLIRRFFRIAPMFYVGAVLYTLLNGTGPQRFAPEGVHLHQFVLTGLFLHIWAADSFNAVVPGGWSIGNEATFYLIFLPLLGVITTLRRAVLAFVLAAVLSKLVRVFTAFRFGHDDLMEVFSAFSFPAQFAAFMGGFVVFHLIRHVNSTRKIQVKSYSPVCALFFICLLLAVAFSNVDWLRSPLLGIPIWIGLITAVSGGGSKWIVNSIMGYLGKVSYSVYILHFALVGPVKSAVAYAALDNSPVAQLVATYITTLSVAALLASVTYHFVERPMIKCGKLIT